MRLARALEEYAGDPDVVVLALPRGGVPVAYEIATRFGAPLDVLIVRKLGVPGHDEFAMGAIASGDVEVIDEEVVHALGIPRAVIDAIAARERRELERRERLFRGDRPPLDLRGKTTIVVDDGLATGSTMAAAIAAVRQRGAARVISAAPVGTPSACAELAHHADRVVCLATPPWLHAVGQAYDDFRQTTDDEVRELLDRARNQQGDHAASVRNAST